MKLLYNKTTGFLQPWPAGDAEHVVGLEDIYQEFGVLQDAPPSSIPAGHHLKATEAVDHEARTVLRGWVVVEDIPLPPPAPTMRSFRLACGRALWTRIAAAIAGITDEDAKWEAQQYILTSPNVTRTHPLVIQLATAIGLSAAEVDSVFARAQQLDATI